MQQYWSIELTKNGSLIQKQSGRTVALVDPRLLEAKCEHDLFAAISSLEAADRPEAIFAGISKLKGPVDAFLNKETGVQVMCDDIRLRQNRIDMLRIVHNYSRLRADFNAIVV